MQIHSLRNWVQNFRYSLTFIFSLFVGLLLPIARWKSQNLLKVSKLRQNMQKFISSSRVWSPVFCVGVRCLRPESTKHLEQTLGAKVKIFFNSENLKKMVLIKNDGRIGLYKPKKIWGGCHHLILVYDASKLSIV